ncbi:MAG: NAD(P)H-dependent oxidoreductase [Clostridiales bacterium]|nr:NAD(P)H-dependent oxidoreductase [Clostridiales bacterium]MDD7034710.1 NAD(P)H-dependent oxidoreductase [Bacillota bacterium]MDY2919662.1 flavodoxin [Lentihominibacter sp.]
MQVYYFTRTGRSRAIADEIAERYNTEARKIEDHKNWDGKLNYMKAGFMACRGKAIPADYVEPDMSDDIVVVFPLWAGTMPPGVKTFVESVGRENITAVVTSLGSKLKNRDGFRRIIDLVGDEIAAPEDI